jgi:hypothetical protein
MGGGAFNYNTHNIKSAVAFQNSHFHEQFSLQAMGIVMKTALASYLQARCSNPNMRVSCSLAAYIVKRNSSNLKKLSPGADEPASYRHSRGVVRT